MNMDMKSADRQFWLRFLLVVGMLFGTMPLITLPIVLRGWVGSEFGFFTTAFGAFTVLPACALAFWRRRAACIWLSINGVLVFTAAMQRLVPAFDLGTILNIVSPIAIAGALDYTEIARWPGALER
jgi:hypothetical protein